MFGNIVGRVCSFTVSKNFSTGFSYSGIPECHVENPLNLAKLKADFALK